MSRLLRRGVLARQKPVPIGIAAGAYLQTLATFEQVDSVLDNINAFGGSWFRDAMEWHNIQPTNGSTYDWSVWDEIATRCAARNLNVLACPLFTPQWARTGGTISSPPDSNTTFTTFLTTAVNRYKTIVKHWEIWNEPNYPIYWGNSDADPVRYASLLSAAYDAIKAEDPTAKVIAGGTSPAPTVDLPPQLYSPPDWYDLIFDEGAGAKCDAIAHHPYCYPVPPTWNHAENSWRQMFDTSPSIGSVLAAHGLSKKLWLTEFGAPTDSASASQATVANGYGQSLNPVADHVDQDLQGYIIAEAVTEVRKRPDRFGPMFIYEMHDRGTDTNEREHWFGIRTHIDTNTPKEAWTDLQNKITQTGGR